jgi:hypothetical protein
MKEPCVRTSATEKSKSRLAADRRERARAARQAAERQAKRRRLLTRTGVGVGVLAVAGAVAAVAVTSGGSSSTVRSGALPAANSFGSTTLPPWPVPADVERVVRAAGLAVAPMGNVVDHFHVHLDVLANGKPLPIAADIGVDPQSGGMSPLHTHDGSGIVHVEAAQAGDRYTLGQLFNEWNVKLDATRLGGLVSGTGQTLRAYVDGKPVTGNPASIELLDHREIALVFGPPNAQTSIPSSYDFAKADL